MIAALSEFVRHFVADLPAILPRFVLAWAVSFGVLIPAFRWLRPKMRHDMARLDHHARQWALGLRFHTRDEPTTDRVLRTWFFRFWTNFASAPSLGALSVALATWAFGSDQPRPELFYLPGLAFLGSMWLSWTSKRVFRRPRPPRSEGAFGHRLKDGSFPSGHSLTALSFWSAVVVAAALAGLLGIWVLLYALVVLLIVVLTGLSRVYLGVHFPTDVLGGYVMAVVWLVACTFLLLPVL